MAVIASLNVNSVRARLPNLLTWLRAAKPDVVLLQEIKCQDEQFPRLDVEDLGYSIATHGQKSYNGVAILSRIGLEDVTTGLPGEDGDDHARYMEALVGGSLRVGCLYAPNGNPVASEKFPYKLRWLSRLIARTEDLLDGDEMFVLGGDYNIIPEPDDAHDPRAWLGDALYQPESRAAYRTLLNLGLTDAVRGLDKSPGIYTFWDYQGGAFQRDHGIRIDHLLLSPQAADRLEKAGVDREPRRAEKASDHTPVWCELAL